MRRALVRGIAAFAAVFAIGTGLLYALHALADRGGDDLASPTPSTSPEPTAGGPITPNAYLAWVPGGLPAGFARSLGRQPDVGIWSVAIADNVWMLRSYDAAGHLKDHPAGGYMIPIDATGIDPITFAPFLPSRFRRTIRRLGDREGILSATSARLRGIELGGQLEFADGLIVTIVKVLPDSIVGGYELMVNEPTGRLIGIEHQRYVVFRPAEGAELAGPKDLRRRFRALLPAGAMFHRVEVRAPGDTRFLRMSDLLLPPAWFKVRFGEFAARPDPADPGLLDVDPRWVERNIQTVSVPLLGAIECHRKFVPLVHKAMLRLQKDGMDALVQTYSGCYSPRTTLGAPGASISHHAWGAAIDINAPDNPFGTAPTADQRTLATAMERFDLIWGGRFIVPDPHHFEWWVRLRATAASG